MNKSKQTQTVEEPKKIYSPLGCNCYWSKNPDGSDWHGEVCVEHVKEMLAKNRKAILEEIRSLSLKEFEEQMALALKTGDEQKAILAGYAKGVISRLLSLLEGKNESKRI